MKLQPKAGVKTLPAQHRTKKKIGLVSPVPPPLGGIAIQAMKLYSHLKDEGFEVVLIPTNRPMPVFLEGIEKVKFVRTFVRTILILKDVNSNGNQLDAIFILTSFHNFFLWVAAPVILLSKLKGKKVILNARGGGAATFFKKWGWLVKPVIKMSEAVIVPSGFLAKVFKDYLGLETSIVPNIADLSQFKYRKRKVIRPRILVTRNLERIYGIDDIIRAFKVIHKKYPESHLTIAGSGKLKNDLVELARETGVYEKIDFLGAVAHDQLPKIYDRHDILLNASRVDNFPGSIIEALASGLPVVSTNAGGIPYIVQHGETGLMTDINDYKSLADGVVRLLENQSLACHFAEEASKLVKNYTWDMVRKTIVPLLCE